MSETDILSMLESGKSKSTYVSRNLKKKDVYSGNLNTKNVYNYRSIKEVTVKGMSR